MHLGRETFYEKIELSSPCIVILEEPEYFKNQRATKNLVGLGLFIPLCNHSRLRSGIQKICCTITKNLDRFDSARCKGD
jgi:hypothetical protein